MSKPRRTVAAFSASIATCAPTATAYGACISATMNDVHKGVCEKEFIAFKECVQASMKRKW
ncbi:hypothetical protein BGX26_001321 [Mortierella sp. AD094]|nr:hypothetical protein BGX20_002033 [Mortierella sp. AD010]KAF9347180.1 hypothetical protein BGX26_001321 [Mortierella sp. AD094]KAF9379912.1 hypothetical protein BGX21_002523 [Mortierella sp. AD011]